MVQLQQVLFNMKEGQQIGIRGPYGNSFDLKKGKLLLVGGGTGPCSNDAVTLFYSTE